MKPLHFLALSLILAGCATTQPSVQEQVKAVCGLPAKDLINIEAYVTCANMVLDQIDMQRIADMDMLAVN